jgi:cysteine desulfurase/selenocysteine lyase
MTQVSNAIGTVLPVTEITALAHRVGARVLIDGAQSVQHMPVNVQDIGCDFFCLSGHKIFAPTGIGALYGRLDLLEQMPPWQGGGSMIESVTFEQSVFAPVPAKFEAGTPILAGAVGLGAAVDYVSQVGLPIIARHEHHLMSRLVEGLSTLKRVRIIGNPKQRAGALSFVIDGIDTGTIGAMLDKEGIAVRVGHHCAQPALAHFGLKASVRPSFALYNTSADVDALIEALDKIVNNAA